MPFSSSYKKGMGFPKRGEFIEDFKVIRVKVDHVSIKPTRRYEYPTEIVVKGKGDIEMVEKTFKQFFNVKSKKILSGYGNPYVCDQGKREVNDLGDGIFSIRANGVCIRLFEE